MVRTLSAQLRTKDAVGIPTRTERLVYKQRIAKAKREEISPEEIKEIERLQKEDFSKVTNPEEYSQKYSQLSSRQQQFFITPLEFSKVKEGFISDEVKKVDNRLAHAKQQYLYFRGRRGDSSESMRRSAMAQEERWNAEIYYLERNKGLVVSGQTSASEVIKHAQSQGKYQMARELAPIVVRTAEQPHILGTPVGTKLDVDYQKQVMTITPPTRVDMSPPYEIPTVTATPISQEPKQLTTWQKIVQRVTKPLPLFTTVISKQVITPEMTERAKEGAGVVFDYAGATVDAISPIPFGTGRATTIDPEVRAKTETKIIDKILRPDIGIVDLGKRITDYWKAVPETRKEIKDREKMSKSFEEVVDPYLKETEMKERLIQEQISSPIQSYEAILEGKPLDEEGRVILDPENYGKATELFKIIQPRQEALVQLQQERVTTLKEMGEQIGFEVIEDETGLKIEPPTKDISPMYLKYIRKIEKGDYGVIPLIKPVDLIGAYKEVTTPKTSFHQTMKDFEMKVLRGTIGDINLGEVIVGTGVATQTFAETFVMGKTLGVTGILPKTTKGVGKVLTKIIGKAPKPVKIYGAIATGVIGLTGITTVSAIKETRWGETEKERLQLARISVGKTLSGFAGFYAGAKVGTREYYHKQDVALQKALSKSMAQYRSERIGMIEKGKVDLRHVADRTMVKRIDPTKEWLSVRQKTIGDVTYAKQIKAKVDAVLRQSYKIKPTKESVSIGQGEVTAKIMKQGKLMGTVRGDLAIAQKGELARIKVTTPIIDKTGKIGFKEELYMARTYTSADKITISNINKAIQGKTDLLKLFRDIKLIKSISHFQKGLPPLPKQFKPSEIVRFEKKGLFTPKEWTRSQLTRTFQKSIGGEAIFKPTQLDIKKQIEFITKGSQFAFHKRPTVHDILTPESILRDKKSLIALRRLLKESTFQLYKDKKGVLRLEPPSKLAPDYDFTRKITPSESKKLIQQLLQKGYRHPQRVSQDLSMIVDRMIKAQTKSFLLPVMKIQMGVGLLGAVDTRQKTLTKGKYRQVQDTALTQLLGIAQKITPIQDTKQVTKSILQSVTQQLPATTTPPSVTPSPTPTIPPIYPFGGWGLPFPFGGIPKVKKGRQQIDKKIQAYLPSFSARALGIKPFAIGKEDANKLLTQLQTGLEIRRPVIVR